jgi:Protein of unknown function (DUF1579)
MSDEAQAQQMPKPDPALKRLDRFVGTWEMKGRTLNSKEDNVVGRAAFEWLPGGFFLQQRIELDFVGYQVRGLEIIGYDPATGKFPSTVYASVFGTPVPYLWDVQENTLTITTEMIGAIFRGEWNHDRTTFSGGWRPMEGREGPGNVAYDISGSRAK